MEVPQPPAAAPADATLAGAPEPRKLSAGAGAGWWGESWRIFTAAPGPWIGILVVFVVITFLLMLIPLVGSLAQTVLTPVFAGGVMLGCHALARGEPLRLGHLFSGFEGGRFGPLCVLGLLWLAFLVAAAIVVVAAMFLAFGPSGTEAVLNFSVSGNPADYAALSSAGALAVLLVVLIAVAAALLVAMAYWFAPALVVLNGEKPVAALKKSFAASWTNFGAFLLYGLIYIGLAIVASIPFGLGWLVLGPMIAGSCYAGWRTIFGR